MQKRIKFEENEVIGRRSRHKSPALGYIRIVMVHKS